jgi:hypothetical protein
MGKLGISVFAADGTPLEQLPMQMTDGIPFKWVELSNGRIAVQMRLMNIPGRSSVTEPRDIFLLRDSNGKVLDTLLILPAGETIQFGAPGQMKMKVFSPEPMWTISDDGTIYQGLNSEYSINVYDTTGSIRRIVRRSVEPRPVTEDDKNVFRKMVRDAAAAQGAPESALDAFVQSMEFAPFYPKIGNIMAGPDATLWVQRTQTAEEMKALGADFDPQDLGSPNWDVYNRDGKFLGLLKMPARYTPLRWVGDRLVGIALDDNDVQFLTLLAIPGLRG